MRIVIESIPVGEHRYSTAGDYWSDADGTLQIRVAEMADARSMALVAIHEFVEVVLCEHHGISEESITAFDMGHLELDEPGASPDAPYHKEHGFAESIERLMALALDRDWEEHEADISALFEA